MGLFDDILQKQGVTSTVAAPSAPLPSVNQTPQRTSALFADLVPQGVSPKTVDLSKPSGGVKRFVSSGAGFLKNTYAKAFNDFITIFPDVEKGDPGALLGAPSKAVGAAVKQVGQATGLFAGLTLGAASKPATGKTWAEVLANAVKIAEETGQFGKTAGEAGATIAPFFVAPTVAPATVLAKLPYAIDAWMIYSVGKNIVTVAKEAGVRVDQGAKPSENILKSLTSFGAKGWEILGADKESADIIARSNLGAGAGIAINALFAYAGTHGLSGRFANDLAKTGNVIKGNQIVLTSEQFAQVARSKGVPMPDLPPGEVTVTVIRPTLKGKLFQPLSKLTERIKARITFKPAEQPALEAPRATDTTATATQTPKITVPGRVVGEPTVITSRTQLEGLTNGQPVVIDGYAAIVPGSTDSGFRYVDRELAQGEAINRNGQFIEFPAQRLETPAVAAQRGAVLEALKNTYKDKADKLAEIASLQKDYSDLLAETGLTTNLDPEVRAIDAFIKRELSNLGFDGVIYTKTGEFQVFNVREVAPKVKAQDTKVVEPAEGKAPETTPITPDDIIDLKPVVRLAEMANTLGVFKNVRVSRKPIIDKINNQRAPTGVDPIKRELLIDADTLMEDLKHLMAGREIETGGGRIIKRQPNEKAADLEKRYFDNLLQFETDLLKGVTVDQAVRLKAGEPGVAEEIDRQTVAANSRRVIEAEVIPEISKLVKDQTPAGFKKLDDYIDSLPQAIQEDLELTVQFHGTRQAKELSKAIADGKVKISGDGLMGKGFYITPSAQAAEMFGREVQITTADGGTARTMTKEPAEVFPIDLRGLKMKFDTFGKSEYYDFLADNYGGSPEAYNTALKKQGYDGLILRDRGEGIIFDGAKVKSLGEVTKAVTKAEDGVRPIAKAPEAKPKEGVFIKDTQALLKKAYDPNLSKKDPAYIQSLLTKIRDEHAKVIKNTGYDDTSLSKQGYGIKNLSDAIDHVAKIRAAVTKPIQSTADRLQLEVVEPTTGLVVTKQDIVDYVTNKERPQSLRNVKAGGGYTALTNEQFLSLPDEIRGVMKQKKFPVSGAKNVPEELQDTLKVKMEQSIAQVKAGQFEIKPTTKGFDVVTDNGVSWPFENMGRTQIAKAPVFNKSMLRKLAQNSPEFTDNPVLTVETRTFKGIETKVLAFNGGQQHFAIVADALGLKSENLKVGDVIAFDPDTLKVKGQEIRVKRYSAGESSDYAYRPKESAEATQGTDKARDEFNNKALKRSEIADRLSQILNVPIRRGHFRSPGAAAIYKRQPKVIRYKTGGLPAKFHEVGHFIDSTIGFSDLMLKGNIALQDKLLTEYGRPPKDPKRHRQEAFAEFLRYYMTGQRSKLNEIDPELIPAFEKRLEAYPEVRTAIEDASADFARWNEMPATAKVLSQISLEQADSKEGIGPRLASTWHDFYTLSKDDLHPINQFEDLARQLTNNQISTSESAYLLARLSRGWAGQAEVFLNQGTFGKDFYTVEGKTVKPKFTGPSLKAILEPIDQAGNLTDFRVYLVSKRAVELADRKIETGIKKADAAESITELEAKHPEFKEASTKLYTYQDSLLKLLQDYGALGEEGYKNIKKLNQYRVPFYRVMEQSKAIQGYMGGSKKFAPTSTPIKKIRGSDLDIADPLEGIVKDTYAITNFISRYQVARAMAELAEKDYQLGRLFEEIPQAMKPITITAKEVLDKIMGDEVVAMMPDDVLSDFTQALNQAVTVFRPTLTRGDNIIDMPWGDSRRVYQVEPALYRSIQGLDRESANLLIRLFSIPAKFLRAGATLVPEFSFRNPFRDQGTAMIMSENNYIPILDFARGIFHILGRDDIYTLWKMSGGPQATLISMDRKVLSKNLKEILRSRTASALRAGLNPLKILQAISETGEIGTRLGDFAKSLSRTRDPRVAAYDAREVTLDFARQGAKLRSLNMIRAFFNATIEGLDRFARAYKKNPGRTTWRVLAYLTLPSVLLYLLNRDDPRWDEIPQWQKDTSWIIFGKNITKEEWLNLTPEERKERLSLLNQFKYGIYRIPKPFVMGQLFGSLPERILEYVEKQDPRLLKQVARTLIEGANPGILPTGVEPIIENITNYDFFFQRPIVPQAKEDLPPAQQYSLYTSRTARELGRILNYSPAKIDNLIQGYFAGLGIYATKAVDSILTGTKIVAPEPDLDKSLADMPVLKAFVIRDPIGSSSESVQRFYEMAQQADGHEKVYRQMIVQGRYDEAAQYVERYPVAKYAPALRSWRTYLSDLGKARDFIRNDRNLTSTERRIKIDEMNAMILDLAQKALYLTTQPPAPYAEPIQENE